VWGACSFKSVLPSKPTRDDPRGTRVAATRVMIDGKRKGFFFF
jgi:hypothetical protein